MTTHDPSGRRTVVSYSNNNNNGKNPVSVVHDDWSVDRFAYDAFDRDTMVQMAGDSATYYHYNGASQVDSVWGLAAVATGYHYNPDNTLASTTDATGVSVTYTYNASKEVTSATDNMAHQTTYGYDAVFMNQNTVTAPGPRTTTSVIDAYGRPSMMSAPLAASVTTEYDLVNRPIRETQAGRPATVLTYDPLFMTDMTDANGNVTHTDHNALGWPVSRRDASGAVESFRYDIAGRMTSWTNRRGDVMSYTYDNNDRILSRSGRNIDDHYSYSPDGNVMVAWNSVERDSIFHTSVAGSRLGADSTVTWVNGARYSVVHNHVGALNTDVSTSISSSSGVGFRIRSVSVGANGLVSQVGDGFNTAALGYNGEALITSLANPATGTRSADYTSSHSPDVVSFSGPELNGAFGRNNHYDMQNRIDAIGSPGSDRQQVFSYDAYGELAGVNTNYNCGAGIYDPTYGTESYCNSRLSTVVYGYDNVGNRTDLGATYYAGNRLGNFNGGFLRYDADGNVTQKYGVQPNPHNQLFYWNAESRLDSVSYDQYYTVRYEYNALGKPVRKYRQGALDRVWLWDDEQLLAEFDGNNARVADYQYSGTDQPYAYTYGASSPTGVRYHEQDALGNVMGTHEGTSVTQTITYDAWGVPSVSGNLDSHLMWKGLMWEGDVVGLYYMRGRWYDPELGRFIQEDPIHSGVNDYAFAGDDPVNGSDPSGLDGDPIYIWGIQGTDWSSAFETLLEELGGGASGSGSFGNIGGGGSGGSTAAPTQPKPKPKLTPKCNDQRSETQLSAGASALLGGPFVSAFFGVGASGGVTSSGRVFVQLQGSITVGLGAYLGYGYGASGGRATVTTGGLSTGSEWLGQVNGGLGPSAGASVTRDCQRRLKLGSSALLMMGDPSSELPVAASGSQHSSS